MSTAIEAHNLTVTYNNKPALWDVDFSAPNGKIIGILGPNGSGKSTLLKTMMGLIKPAGGYTKIFDKDIDDVRSRVSYVPQRESVDWDFPTTVLDVVLMGRYKPSNIFKRLKKQDKEIAMNALKKVKMEDFVNRQISQLSGGQQQRVFLARALAQQGDIYFMDEPFVGVDAVTEASILELLHEMKEQGKTVVIVHHDLQTASDVFDWAVLLNTRLVACGPSEKVFTKENLTNAFGGKLNILDELGNIIKENEFPVRE